MRTACTAYIDESGDEGFRFRRSADEQASSDWFVLAALVAPVQTDAAMTEAARAIRSELQLRPVDPIRWKKLKHIEKVRLAQIMAALPARVAAVCVHKPSLAESGKFGEPCRLHFYAVRCLLERVSWLARDIDGPAPGDGGATTLVFPDRQGIPYDRMRAYLQLLQRRQRAGQDVRIEFDRVSVAGFRTQTPNSSMGLQLADAAAGAFLNALERDRFGNTEPRYLQTLSPLLYRHEESLHGYGFKILPTRTIADAAAEPSLSWLAQFE
jgi:hypothetical protein